MFKYYLNGSIRRLLVMAGLALAALAAGSAPVHGEITYAGTAHTQVSGPGHAILGQFHLTLHEDDHGHPHSLVGDDTEAGRFKLLFQPLHNFHIETIRGDTTGVFRVRALSANYHQYLYHVGDALLHQQTIVAVTLRKISATEVSLRVDLHMEDLHHSNYFQAQATLHKKAP